jgi:hypothetical protein
MSVKFFLGSPLTILAIFVLAGLCAGQASTPQPLEVDDGQDDILLLVKIEAKELKMDAVPNSTVTFPGTEPKATVWATERKNLPEKLEPGVSYRDIGITLRISSRLENIEQIVREALGEATPASTAATSDSPTVAKPMVSLASRRIARSRKSRPRT